MPCRSRSTGRGEADVSVTGYPKRAMGPRGLVRCVIAGRSASGVLSGSPGCLMVPIPHYFAERMMMQKPGKAFDSIAEALKPQGNSKHPYVPQPELQLIYDTAPVGL